MKTSRIASIALLLGAPSISAAQETPRPVTLFINYEGAKLSPGNDSALDQLSCIDAQVDTPGFFGSLTIAQQTTEEVRAILAPFAVRVVDERPPAYLPYTMAMVGGLAEPLGLDPGVGGYACLVDCGDEVDRETVLVFAEEVRDPRELAQTIVHEAGHSWGLDHVVASDLIMNGTTSGADRSLADGCTPLEEQGGTHCGERHAQLCDSAAMQDSVGELLQLRGPHQPDVVPPRIQILSPAPGSQFVPGQSVTIEVEVDDDYPGHGWRYVVPELAWSARSYGETSLDLQFPPGEFTVRVEAMDQAGNASVAEIQLTVDDSASSDAPSDSDIPPDDIDAATGDDSEAGCRVGGSGPSAPGALAVVFLLWLRARRRALPSTAD